MIKLGDAKAQRVRRGWTKSAQGEGLSPATDDVTSWLG